MAVVVAVDGSSASKNAICVAAREAEWRQVSLVAVTAYRTDRTAGAPAGRPLSTLRTSEDDRRIAEVGLEDAVRGALGHQADRVEKRTVAGLAGRAIVDAARGTQANLIVLTARPGTSLLPASVSQYVLRNAECPVLLVPPRNATT